MTFWDILKIDETTDKKKIRHAYAELSKECHPETEPEKFEQLYGAYQEALKYAKSGGAVHSSNESFSDESFTNESGLCKAGLSFDDLDLYEADADESKSPSDEKDSLYIENIYAKNSSTVAKGLEAFKEFFEVKGEKDWKKFMTRPEFLKVQFDEGFALALAHFLESQTAYPVEQLPFDLVKELYFAYYPFIQEHESDVFSDGFDELFKVIYKNNRIENVIKKHENPHVWNEVVKYWVYYGLYSNIKKNGPNQDVKAWAMYTTEIAGREFYKKDDVKTPIDDNVYPMIAFLIREAPTFSDEIYDYLINRFNLSNVKNTSRRQTAGLIYDAIEEKGIKIDASQKKQEINRKEVSYLMQEFKKIYSLDAESDRTKIRSFFRSEIYDRHKLDSKLLDGDFMFFALIEATLFSRIFLEEYKLYYDEIYAKVSTQVGKIVYNKLMFYLNNERKIGENCKEIVENRQQWVLKYFFEDGFTKVWTSTPDVSMPTVYKGLLKDHLKIFTESRHYERDIWHDGRLYALKENDNYIFIYEKIEEKTILSMQEYLYLLKNLYDICMEKYYFSNDEKEEMSKLMEMAEKVYGCNRN